MNEMKLFGSSGIRGVVDEEMTKYLCFGIGQAIGSSLAIGSKVCIAIDVRASGDYIKSLVSAGILSTGVDITDMGLLPTPSLVFMTKAMGFDTGIVITASHNPPEFNGIKLFNRSSFGYNEEQENDIEKIFFSKNFRKADARNMGHVNHLSDAKKEYIERFKKILPPIKPNGMKIVVDPGSGAMAGIGSELLKELGFNIIPLNDEPDGLFNKRPSEPREDTLQDTIKFLREKNADLAICFDGDGDRVVFCDREGFLGYNEMIAYISRIMLKRSSSKKIATTVETGRLLDLAVKDLGGDVIRGEVGDIKLAHFTEKIGACFGVEQVGHYIIPEVGYYPETLYASILLLNNITSPDDIRSFFKTIPRLYYAKEGIDCDEEKKYLVMKKVEGLVNEFINDFDCKEVNKKDGIRLEFEDSWILIRTSGTQPLIRIIVESESEEKMNELLEKSKDILLRAMEMG